MFNPEMFDEFKRLGSAALTYNHYDLAEKTTINDTQAWKDFLTDPAVSDWIESEIAIIQDSELKKMIADISKSRSVGQAQLINALSKLSENKQTKEGATFIYTYVPLSPEQEQAENVIKLDKDPFIAQREDDFRA